MDTESLKDPVEPLYDARIRGTFFITTGDGTRVHMHGGCWIAPCSSDPPRMMVAFPKEFEGAEIVARSGRFALNLVARRQRTWLDEFFYGKQDIAEIGPERFLRSPGGCPVPADSVAYFDCTTHKMLDLGDFLLVIGDVTAAEVLNPESENLTVNEVVATADPRREEKVKLPFEGFDFDVSQLKTAPVTPGGPPDAARFEKVYGTRQWGLFFVSAAFATDAGRRGHWHVGCWSMQTSHRPPRMAVCFSKDWESAGWVEKGAPFALTLLAEDQAEFVRQFARGRQQPADYDAETFSRRKDGLFVLPDGIAYFICRPERVVDVGNFLLAVAPVEEYGWLREDATNLRDQDLAGLLGEGEWREPVHGFPL